MQHIHEITSKFEPARLQITDPETRHSEELNVVVMNIARKPTQQQCDQPLMQFFYALHDKTVNAVAIFNMASDTHMLPQFFEDKNIRDLQLLRINGAVPHGQQQATFAATTIPFEKQYDLLCQRFPVLLQLSEVFRR